MRKVIDAKQTLFISYCWSDGTPYADELEKQLSVDFSVKRDRTQLGCNDDIDAYMRKIAECDNVVIVLTNGYVHSINCMKEIMYLIKQPDWFMKSVILVIDNDIYKWEKQKEIIVYWNQYREHFTDSIKDIPINRLFSSERSFLEKICDKLEDFFIELKRRYNPSQIAIVNEIKHMSKRDKTTEKELIELGKKKVEEIVIENKITTFSQLQEETNMPVEVVDRFVGALKENRIFGNPSTEEIIFMPDSSIVASYLSAKGKKSVEELDDEEYCELEYAIANAHQHM